jgi:hypothetical protein
VNGPQLLTRQMILARGEATKTHTVFPSVDAGPKFAGIPGPTFAGVAGPAVASIAVRIFAGVASSARVTERSEDSDEFEEELEG